MKKLLILGLTLTLTSSLSAYTLNSVAESGARWKDYPISMKLNPANSGLPDAEVQRVISSAMGKWNTGIAVEVLQVSSVDHSVTAATGMSMDGINSITFSNNFREDSNGFDPDVTVAVGGQYGDGDTMVDAFVIFNAESVLWNTDKVNSTNKSISYSDDLETIALHELGHVQGLGHTTVDGAVMNPVRATKILRELSQDDIEGGQYLVNSGASGSGNSSSSNASKTAGCGSITNNNTGNNGSNIGGMSAVMLLPLSILIFARKRTRVTN